MVLERLLRVPWTARRLNQAILKEINPEYSLEGLMLKLKFQYFGPLMRITDSLKKTLMLERLGAGGEGDDRGWGGQMASPTWWTWVWASSGSWWWTGRPGMLQSMGFQRVGHDWATELNWTMLPKTHWALDTTRHHPEGSLWMSAFKHQTSPTTQAQSLPVFVTHEEPEAQRLEGIFSGHPLVSHRPRV